MSPSSRSVRRAVTTAVVTVATGLALSGCGVGSTRVAPGAAAEVGDATIGLSEVNDAAGDLCEMFDVLTEQGAAQPVPGALIRKDTLRSLVLREVADQLSDEYDAGAGDSYGPTVDDLTAQLLGIGVDADLVDRVVPELAAIAYYGDVVTADRPRLRGPRRRRRHPGRRAPGGPHRGRRLGSRPPHRGQPAVRVDRAAGRPPAAEDDHRRPVAARSATSPCRPRPRPTSTRPDPSRAPSSPPTCPRRSAAAEHRLTTVPADGEPLLDFAAVMRRLRTDCAWKREQTHRSLARYLLEETHETLEAIETGTPDDLREELGDLLLQVYFHAVIAEEEGTFTLDDVARGITEKMVRRNPHVFGDAPDPADPAAVNDLWESVKAGEKQRDSVLDGLAPTLPALLYADKVLDRLARAGGPPPSVPAEGGEGGDLGDRLLALVAEARETGTDPEQALRDAVRRLL